LINVIASIRLKAGSLAEFVEIFSANVPNVRSETGCIEYFPTVDISADLAPQKMDKNVVTVIEKWETLEALRNHLRAPHMLSYKNKVQHLVEEVSLKVLGEI